MIELRLETWGQKGRFANVRILRSHLEVDWWIWMRIKLREEQRNGGTVLVHVACGFHYQSGVRSDNVRSADTLLDNLDSH